MINHRRDLDNVRELVRRANAAGVSHTPGLWEVHDEYRIGEFGERGPTVCAVTGEGLCQPLFELCGPEDIAQCRANLDLAAAAPDLLAACKSACDYLIRYATDSQGTIVGGPPVALFMELREALDKAEGTA